MTNSSSSRTTSLLPPWVQGGQVRRWVVVCMGLWLGVVIDQRRLSAAEPTAEVRRAVAVTVRLAEPVGTVAAGRVVGASGGVMAGAGGELGNSDGLDAADGERRDGDEGVTPVVAAVDAAQADLRTAKRVVISLEAGVLYDDNIFLNARDQVADVLWRASAEGRLNFGDAVVREESHLVARYRPDAYFFQDNTDENTVDHEAGLVVRKKFAKLALDAAGTYQRTSGSTVELGDRVARDVVAGRAGLTYGWGAKTSFSTSMRWDATAYREGNYDDYHEWVHEGFGDYQATEKFRFGLGGGYGRLEVDDGSAPQDFQRALVRVTHASTGKLSVSGRAGLEFRQTEVGDSTTPVFGVDASHDVTAKTSVRLQAMQEVAASGAQEGQNYIRTGISAGLTHKLNDRIALSLDGGWEQFDYERVRQSAPDLGGREDTNVFVRPGFTYTFGDRWKAEAWYQWRSADSSDPDQVYDANQAGFNLLCTF